MSITIEHLITLVENKIKTILREKEIAFLNGDANLLSKLEEELIVAKETLDQLQHHLI